MFHAAADDSEESWARPRPARVVGRDRRAVPRHRPITPPAGWVQVFGGDGHQMVPTGRSPRRRSCPRSTRRPGGASRSARSATTTSTRWSRSSRSPRPGPFRPRTIELGGYVGIFHDSKLVAMAGQRLRPPGYCEVSAVCTHPDARRRGYALDRHRSRRRRRSRIVARRRSSTSPSPTRRDSPCTSSSDSPLGASCRSARTASQRAADQLVRRGGCARRRAEPCPLLPRRRRARPARRASVSTPSPRCRVASR